MPAKTVQIPAKDKSGTFSAYLALPDGGVGPGIIIIQEIFGVNTPMRQICDRLAADGYMALCPDLFWRQEPGVELTDKVQADWDKAFSLYKGFDNDKAIEDIAASIDWLRHFDGNTGKVGSVGFCLGGLLAYLTACRTDADANVSYYGVGIDGFLDEADGIKGAVLMHIAEEDEFVDKAAQARVHAALDGHAKVTLHDYAGANHAFARPDGNHFKADAAEKANTRTDAFFAQHLKA